MSNDQKLRVRRLPVVTLVLLVSLASGCTKLSPPEPQSGSKGRRTEFPGTRLGATPSWNQTYGKYLESPLWIGRDAYDAGNELMVPLHAAFFSADSRRQSQFSEHFGRFYLNRKDLAEGDLDRLQYLYLSSRFAQMAAERQKSDLIPQGLPEFLAEEVLRLWTTKPAWMYEREPFAGGMRERLAWKLTVGPQDVKYQYFRAIFDHELFLFAIASDLRSYERSTAHSLPWSETISDVLGAATKTIRNRGVASSKGGWLFQPGIWSEHPDYAYAGHTQERPGLKPLTRPGVAEDSSHSHRWPLWLLSLSGAFEEPSAEGAFFAQLRRRLATQFVDDVLVKPDDRFPGWRANNFMDGWNGIYRWNYATVRQRHDGYGPYELSGTLWFGWWTFLGSERVGEMYRHMANLYPLPANLVELYVGPGTSRDRHPMINGPAAYANGVRELGTLLAAEVSRQMKIGVK